MAIDMKEIMAEAARRLLFEKHIKKLTVKDIVAECRITRQTFYYHFEDIPSLIRWDMERHLPELVEEFTVCGSPEESMKMFFSLAINAAPYVKTVMQTNYGAELEALLEEFVFRLFEKIVEKGEVFSDCKESELKILLRYHSQAVLGLLRHWTKEDTENLDTIVHQVMRIISGKIAP